MKIIIPKTEQEKREERQRELKRIVYKEKLYERKNPVKSTLGRTYRRISGSARAKVPRFKVKRKLRDRPGRVNGFDW